MTAQEIKEKCGNNASLAWACIYVDLSNAYRRAYKDGHFDEVATEKVKEDVRSKLFEILSNHEMYDHFCADLENEINEFDYLYKLLVTKTKLSVKELRDIMFKPGSVTKVEFLIEYLSDEVVEKINLRATKQGMISANNINNIKKESIQKINSIFNGREDNDSYKFIIKTFDSVFDRMSKSQPN